MDLHCDQTFIGTGNNFMNFGKWHFKNKTVIVLQIDSSLYRSKASYKKWKMDLTIKDNKLFERTFTKREYKKLNRMIEQSTGEGQNFESYANF